MAILPSALRIWRQWLQQEKDTKSEPPRRKNKVRRRANPVIDAEADVDEIASGEEGFDNDNDDLNKIIVADNSEF